MTAEQLNVKINLDLNSLKSSIKQVKIYLSDMANGVKQSLPKISTEGKKASDSLDKITDAGKSVKKVVQDIGDEAKVSLAKVTTQSGIIKNTLTDVAIAGVNANAGLSLNGGTAATRNTQAAILELQDALDSIQGLTFWDFVTSNLENMYKLLSGVTKSFKDFGSNIAFDFGLLKESATDFFDAFAAFGDFRKELGWDAAFDQFKYEVDGAKDKLTMFKMLAKDSFLDFKDGIKSAGSAFSAEFKEITGISLKFAAVLGGIIATLVTVIALTKNAINVSKLSKEMYVAAAQAGLTAQKFQEWSYVFERAGIEVDELKEVIKTLTEAQVDVLDGTEDVINAFKKLGMSQEEVSGMNQQQLWENTITALQNVEDVTERTAIAYKIFGEDTAKLTTLLNLSNQETSQLISTYSELGAAMSDRLVTRSNILQGSLTNLKNAWQGLKNTLAEAVLPTVIAVVNWVVKAVAVINMLFKAIFGISLTTSSATNSATTSIKKSTAAVGGYSGALKQATSAAEKLKRSVMGFDELNRLPGVDSGSGSAAGDAGGSPSAGVSVPDMGADLSGMIDTDSLGLDKWKQWIEKWKPLIQDITVIALMAIGIWMIVAGVLSCNIPLILGGLGLTTLGVSLGNVEGGSWDRWGRLLKGFWDGMKAWFKQYVAPVFTKAFWLDLWDAVVYTTTTILDAIKNGISNKWNAIKAWFKETVAPVFTKAYWANKFDPIRTAINEKLEAARTAISTKWTSVKNWFKDSVAPKFTKSYWTGKFDTVRSAVSDKVGAAVSVVQDKWNSLKKWFSTNIAPKFTTSYWKNKFSTIGSGAKSAFNSVISIVESAVNGIIKKINTLSWKIPDWVPKFGGQKFGFNFKTISIPRLATGGIVTGSTLANIGERGAEAVLPLTGSQSTAWMDMLAGKIADRSAAGAPTKVVLMLDGKELGWATINNINAITKQTGGLQLAL